MSQIKTNQLLGQGVTYATSENIEYYYMFPKHPRPSNYHAFNVPGIIQESNSVQTQKIFMKQ